MDNVLVLVRHGQSEWNLKNLFTGWRDPDLTEKGVAEAIRAGEMLKAEGLRFDIAFTSVLHRAAYARPHARQARPDRSRNHQGQGIERASLR